MTALMFYAVLFCSPPAHFVPPEENVGCPTRMVDYEHYFIV